jgi:hypothetical protein
MRIFHKLTRSVSSYCKAMCSTAKTAISFGFPFCFLCAAIHSAVRVSTGEADEIAAQSHCGFCEKNNHARRAAAIMAARVVFPS